MKPVEVFLSDPTVKDLGKIPPEEFQRFVDRMERVHVFQEQQRKADLRSFTAKYLLGAGSIILSVSLGLIITQALGLTKLPDTAIATLIGSVAVEFVGMLWMVIRYLFSEGVRDEKKG